MHCTKDEVGNAPYRRTTSQAWRRDIYHLWGLDGIKVFICESGHLMMVRDRKKALGLGVRWYLWYSPGRVEKQEKSKRTGSLFVVAMRALEFFQRGNSYQPPNNSGQN